MSERAKRKAARVRLKRLAIFLPLAALAPFWLGYFGNAGRTGGIDVPGVILAVSQRLPAGTIEDLPDQRFLAATASIVDSDARAGSVPFVASEAPTAPRPVEAPAGTARSVVPARTVAPARPAKPSAPKPRPRPRPRPKPRPRRRTRTMRMLVTAYCACPKCCGSQSDGITASGRSIYANGSRFVAADTRLLGFNTRLSIPGYYGGAPVSVLDRGGKIKGRRLDVFFLSHERAKRWGARWLNVTIYAK